MRSATERIFGAVTVIVPPSGMLALSVAALALLLLGFVAWFVEIPQRARAIGVLMPPDGFQDIVASAPGRVAAIHVVEGQAVGRGDLLLNITSDAQPLASRQLQILHAEIALFEEAHARQRAIERNGLLTLDEELVSLGRRLTVAQEEYRLQQQQVRLLERRLKRRLELAGSGSVSADMLDQERGLLLEARTRLAAMRHAILGLEQTIAAGKRERGEAEAESARRELLHDRERQRLERDRVAQEYLVERAIRASQAGIVARVNVRTGATANAGEVLLKIYRPYRELEAWLYVSSAESGFVEPGQVVRLRFDAYPHQLFGTAEATVTSVSRVAVVPRELRIPLALSGPVFEIRAALDAAHVKAFDTSWPLAPGTSFQADIVQRRYRLYQWVLRSLGDGPGDRRG